MSRNRLTPAVGGFSLAEILVAVAVIALLAALVIAFVPGALERARSARCSGNLRSIGVAAHLFAADHDGMLPGVLFTPAGPGRELNRHGGQQWDVQIMPYLGVATSAEPAEVQTPLFCPASVVNTAVAMNRQLSYAWNSRLVEADPFNSRRLANLEQPSTVLMVIDNKMLGDQPDRNQVTFNAYGNTIYINNNQNQLRRVPYERHGGHANVLFADGSVSARKPVDDGNPTPQRVRFWNNGPLSAGD